MNDSDKIDLWKQRHFEAQAAAEEFVLREHGQKGLRQWIAANAAITARLLDAQRPEGQSKIQHFMTRLFRQLTLYDSKLRLTEINGQIVLVNVECGILNYRRKAAANGVKLTFESPCDYCESLNTSIGEEYTAQPGVVACRRTDNGCIWSATGG